jgi:predicted phosphodiesterase
MIENLKKVKIIPYDYLVQFLNEKDSPFITLDVKKPTFIIGDLHQDENSFFAILETTRFFEEDINLIFLGDYIDRGKNPWLINKLLYLKNEFKDRVFLLRGNHETSENSKILAPQTDERGFFNQLEYFKKNYPQYMNDEIVEFYKKFFETLPIGIILQFNQFKFFLTHANIPRINLKIKKYHKNLERIIKIKNPIGIPYINDFLWNDLGDKNFTSNVRYQVSKDEINLFLKQFEFDYIVRGHQFVKEGFKIDDRVITIFSTGQNSPLHKEEQNLNSAYNGVPAIFEVTSAKIYQIDIFSKKLIPRETIFYNHNRDLECSFPKLENKITSPLTYRGDIKRIFVKDLYTNKKRKFVLKNELTYNDLNIFYGIDVSFKIELGENYIINNSKVNILVDNRYLLPNRKMKISYPIIINKHLKIDSVRKKTFFRLKKFTKNFFIEKDLRKINGIPRYKFYNKKR